jgi:hypothetical protein
MAIRKHVRKTSNLSNAASPAMFATLQHLDRKIFNNSDFTLPNGQNISKNELKDNINQVLV